MTIGTMFMAGMYCGILANPSDIAPNYAGTLLAITNTFATIPGFIVPVFVGELTHGNVILHLISFQSYANLILNNNSNHWIDGKLSSSRRRRFWCLNLSFTLFSDRARNSRGIRRRLVNKKISRQQKNCSSSTKRFDFKNRVIILFIYQQQRRCYCQPIFFLNIHLCTHTKCIRFIHLIIVIFKLFHSIGEIFIFHLVAMTLH